MTNKAPRRGTPLVAADLFSGAGGITLGLLSAGIDVRFCADLNEACATTHKRNFPAIEFFHGDVRDLKPKTLMKACDVAPGELDLLVGGPPCQGFSIIGGRDLDDPRNGLFKEFMRVATTVRPKVLVIENVPGLATLEGGAALHEIGRVFKKAGYTAGCAEVLAAQYGVPQMRWRLLIVGWRNDLGIDAGGFPMPTHGISGIGDLVPNRTITAEETDGFLSTGAAIGDLPPVVSGGLTEHYGSEPKHPFQVEMRRGMNGELHNHYAPRMSESNIRRIEYLKPGQDWRDLPIELLPEGMKRAHRKDHTRRYRRMTWNGVPRSIITRFRDPKSGEYIHPEQTRTISIREAARIQSFPDWFVFDGAYSDQYDQVGNAVPPLLAKAIGKEVAAVLKGRKKPADRWPKSRYKLYPSSVQASLFPDTQKKLVTREAR